MAQKWTEARRSKFKATMRRLYAEKKKQPLIKMGPVEEWRNSPAELPVVEMPGRNNNNHGGNGYDAEFAAAFAAAWKVYKGL